VDRIAAHYGPLATSGGVATDAPSSTPEASGGVLVRVRGIGDLGGFVRVDRFFKSLDAVESVALERAGPDQALFRLSLRGGVDALRRSAMVGGVLSAEPLEPALPGSDAGAGAESAQLPDLNFRLME